MFNKKNERWYTDPDFYMLVAILLFFVFSIVGSFVYLPQKWEACGKLYNNTFAQWMCFSEG
jgi:polyferredoxin